MSENSDDRMLAVVPRAVMYMTVTHTTCVHTEPTDDPTVAMLRIIEPGAAELVVVINADDLARLQQAVDFALCRIGPARPIDTEWRMAYMTGLQEGYDVGRAEAHNFESGAGA